ncbi:glycosyltransferase [Roseomonas sp. AR75]|uniref:glycosyltransferase n=1 Tax=Roseomonas sp. AR75 TaxID=2562311 RepID=UPI0014852BA7|nr:glycosyltransferase [Roseomonas sp. AR75]
MRILVISPTPSHPQDAGNRARIHALLTALKERGHAIHLCLLLRETVTEDGLAAMRAAWDEVIPVPHYRPAERRTLPGGLNALDDWILPEAERAFAELAAREPGFDMVLVNYVFMSAALLPFPPEVVKVLDTHDVFADRAAKLAALGLPNRFFATTQQEENRGLDRADLVLAIQSEDATDFSARIRAPILTLGHLPAERRPKLPPREPDGRVAIGYIGSSNPMNTRALGRFLGALDLEALDAGGAAVLVAGGAANALEPGPGLVPIGPVADADDLYGRADLVVNPHEGGTGLKIKTVEALERGRPVIGTAEAFAGLPAEAAFHAAADAAEVAAYVRRYVAEPDFRAEVAAASAALAERYAREVLDARALLASRPALARLRDRPRVLLVTDVRFWRNKLGNHQRITALIAATRAEANLDLFFTAPMTAEERQAARRVLGPRSRVFVAGGAQPAKPPADLTPYERSRFSGSIFAAFEAHLAQHPPQAVIVEYLMLSYLRHAEGLPALTVLDTHDVMSVRAQNFKRFGRIHFVRISTAEELRILGGFATVLAIQAEEARWLEALLPGRVLLAPHTVPAVPRAKGSPQGARLRVGFIGGDSPMNRDGLRWVMDQVWPAVLPLGAELHVAGGVCSTMPEGREGVVAHGEVEDGSAFLASLDIAVNPVFYGGGLKIKTVEYLAHGLPCVLSAEALYGIAGGAGEAYVLAPDQGAFIAGLAALIEDAALRARMGAAAQAFARRHFGPRELERAMRALMQLARGVPRPVLAQPA